MQGEKKWFGKGFRVPVLNKLLVSQIKFENGNDMVI